MYQVTGASDSLISYYGVSLAGRSHLEELLPCQDAHLAVKLDERVWLAAVADGVGSATYSEQGAALAVKTLAAYCSEAIEVSSDWKIILAKGFATALNSIVLLADELNLPLREFDTTLTAVVFDGQRSAYGQSGDSGVIGMTTDGRYELLTQVQKGEAYNEVFPLRSGPDKWSFDESGKNYAALILLTDGVLDVAVPSLLADQSEPLYINFIRKFLDCDTMNISCDDLAEACAAYLRSPSCSAISDDMTVLAIWNNSMICNRPDNTYYKEPDWAELRRIRFSRLYPQLQHQVEQHQNDPIKR